MATDHRLFTKKRLLSLAAALLLISVVLVGAGFLLIPRPTTRWSFQPGNLSLGVFSPIVSNGLVYAFQPSGPDDVYAFDAHSGQVRWTASIPGAILDDPQVAVANGFVYVLSDDLQHEQSTLYALSAASGRTQWSHSQQTLSGSPTIANGSVYLHSNNGTVYALDARSGHQLWSAPVAADFGFIPPVVANHMLYITSQNQAQRADTLVALDAASGRQEWVAAGGITVIDQLSAANGLVYLTGDNDNKQVWALDALSGKTTWSAQFPGPPDTHFITSLQVVNGVAYIDDGGHYLGGGTSPGTLYALDARTGQRLWTTTTITAEPTIANGEVYVYTGNGNLSAQDARSGRKLWSHSATPFDDRSIPSEPEPIVESGSVYIRTTQGNNDTLYALNAASGSTQWSYQLSDSFSALPAVAQGIVYAPLDGPLEAIQPPGGPPGFAW
jgi:outer membrane protein assembly factor BamB